MCTLRPQEPLAQLFLTASEACLIYIYVIFTLNYISSNKEIINYLEQYNILNESNAISQRGGFSTYALEKAKGNYFFGLGIGRSWCRC